MPISRTTGERIAVRDHISECVENILLTPITSRPMDPAYGSDLLGLVDLNADPVGLAEIRALTAGAVSRLEVRPLYERADTTATGSGDVTVTVHWSVDGTTSETVVSV